jgi:hypothetical protein
MRTMRRIRNVAFLGLVVTLAWAGQVDLRADSGGFYCGYGDCTLLYDDCEPPPTTTWTYFSYPGPGLPNYGDCRIELRGGTQGCSVHLEDGGLYKWTIADWGGGDLDFFCLQTSSGGK